MRTQKEILAENMIDEEIVLLDEESFHESLIATTEDMRAVYDYEKMAEEYDQKNGCDILEAKEHIDFNIIRSLPYLGAKAPIVIDMLK